MTSRREHFATAERLLEQGRKIVGKVSRLKDERDALKDQPVEGILESLQQGNQVKELTERMDELGKQAMGIWAQAQVHAQLACIPDIGWEMDMNVLPEPTLSIRQRLANTPPQDEEPPW